MIICADDFGLSQDVDEAISILANEKKIDAVSCMVSLPRFAQESLDVAKKFPANVQIGLHLTLTDIEPVCRTGDISSLIDTGNTLFRPFGSLLRRSIAGLIDPRHVFAEAAEQIKRFDRLFGREPAFVDSHLHVHQFPRIREGVLAAVLTIPQEKRPWVRNSYSSLAYIIKQSVSPAKVFGISFFGRRMRRRLIESGVKTNNGFAGIYDYNCYQEYGQFLARFTECLEDPTAVLMAHPGLQEPWRRAEFTALRAVAESTGISQK
jgi:chitin disaccharide deacetylase